MNDAYIRTAHYYETDGMQFVHHANHVHWMEEARMDMMKKRGISYREMEARGIIMPVVSVAVHYAKPVFFDEMVYIETALSFMNGVRAKFTYRMESEAGALYAKGESEHCFLDAKTRLPVNLFKRLPDAQTW